MAVFSGKPGAGTDDGQFGEDGSGDYHNTGTTAFLGNSGGDAIGAFFRIPNVTIPNGSTISAATMTVRARATTSTTTMATLVGPENADNPSTIVDSADGVARTRATQAAWATPSFTSGLNYTTSDFSTGLQTVVNRAGFASGNAVLIFIDDNGSTSSTRRTIDQFNGTNLNTFDVTYIPPGSQPYGTRWDHHRANH
jgi:hypothetical protein